MEGKVLLRWEKPLVVLELLVPSLEGNWHFQLSHPAQQGGILYPSSAHFQLSSHLEPTISITSEGGKAPSQPGNCRDWATPTPCCFPAGPASHPAMTHPLLEPPLPALAALEAIPGFSWSSKELTFSRKRSCFRPPPLQARPVPAHLALVNPARLPGRLLSIRALASGWGKGGAGKEPRAAGS